MPTNFPTAPDDIQNDIANGTLEVDLHPGLHNTLADAVMALETALLPGGPMNLAAHVAAANPHSIYLTQAEGDALYAPIGGGGGGGLTNPVSANLLFTPDATYDIGASGANRPRNLYLAGTATVGDGLTLYTTPGYFYMNAAGASLVLGGATEIYFQTAGASRWRMANNGDLIAAADNAHDIGNAGSLRPRNLYLAGTANATSVLVEGATSGVVIKDRVSNTAWTLYVTGGDFRIYTASGDFFAISALGNPAFNGAAMTTKRTVSGSRGANAALASLLTALSTIGLVTDSSTA